MTRREMLSVRIEGELKEALEKLAAADHRTVSQYVENLIREHVTAKKVRK